MAVTWPSAPGPPSLVFTPVLSCPQAFPDAVCPCRAFCVGRRHSGFASSKKLSSVLLPLSSKQDHTQFSVVVSCSPRVTQKLPTSRGQLLHDSHVAMATLGLWSGLNTEIPAKGLENIHPKQSANVLGPKERMLSTDCHQRALPLVDLRGLWSLGHRYLKYPPLE